MEQVSGGLTFKIVSQVLAKSAPEFAFPLPPMIPYIGTISGVGPVYQQNHLSLVRKTLLSSAHAPLRGRRTQIRTFVCYLARDACYSAAHAALVSAHAGADPFCNPIREVKSFSPGLQCLVLADSRLTRSIKKATDGTVSLNRRVFQRYPRIAAVDRTSVFPDFDGHHY